MSKGDLVTFNERIMVWKDKGVSLLKGFRMKRKELKTLKSKE